MCKNNNKLNPYENTKDNKAASDLHVSIGRPMHRIKQVSQECKIFSFSLINGQLALGST